jgi:arylsulfatase A-like enzyme
MPRNVIIMHTDQQRYDSLGCCGDPSGTTPNIDALATDGCIGDRHMTANPVCEPSRASLFTGLYPQAHGVWSNGVPLSRKDYTTHNDMQGRFNTVIEPLTMADMFANAGFDTVSFGKLHLTPNLAPESYNYPECWRIMQRPDYADWTGPYFGFRHVEITLGHGEQPCDGGHYGRWLNENHPDVATQAKAYRDNHESLVPGVNDLHASRVPGAAHNTTWLADRATSYITQDRPTDKPFFLFVGFPDPHHPFTPSADVLEALGEMKLNECADKDGKGLGWRPEGLTDQAHYDLTEEQWRTIRRFTAAMIKQVDTAVGRIVQAVKDTGLWDDTVILFTSDHGDYLGDHGMLRKGYHADRSLVHVPFVLRSPGHTLPSRFDEPMSNVDVMPTLAELAGIDIPHCTQGRPLSAILNDEDSTAYTYCYSGQRDHANYTIYDRQYRLTWYPAYDRYGLFDHQNDPAECNDLGSDPAFNEVAQLLLSRLKEHAIKAANPIGARVSPW